ncbi:hypothetical protein RvY_01998 [Ramazzottius varieornatus]|uniref:Uncharacterized protein n=1 Tax=Ramazzottius varieornatus TaxID=947166 RepID=A0A1D1UIA4_RAMVA|nr:hypothetical protein RvY_01998 [Ramazzottius varieornatus]
MIVIKRMAVREVQYTYDHGVIFQLVKPNLSTTHLIPLADILPNGESDSMSGFRAFSHVRNNAGLSVRSNDEPTSWKERRATTVETEFIVGTESYG